MSNTVWRLTALLVFMPGESVTLTSVTSFALDGPPEPQLFARGGASLSAADIASLRGLTAEVAGITCGVASPSDLDNGFLYLPVGSRGTPDACREVGAEIRLVRADGARLAVRLTVTPGFYVLSKLTLDPDGPAPASAGSTGLARGEDVSHGVLWLLATLAIVLLARRLAHPVRP